ncbi:uncharacterized protein EV154DRAFT_479942 [Mucor mucedo]|uniref:uncharacterized protein n=1 Tax=Mucor mucedo TaxID=29922 RepID=UPI00221E3B2B|nr:uncharacterized protein EV154DRAFT_479942 [Mucor mucedo]KAI7892850.1 hypothetical protein EV154DRAFT_479942 [Mucor mucedo]
MKKGGTKDICMLMVLMLFACLILIMLQRGLQSRSDIICNDQLGDIFSCEDKPGEATEAYVEVDIKEVKHRFARSVSYMSRTVSPEASPIFQAPFRQKRLLYVKHRFARSVSYISSPFFIIHHCYIPLRMTESGTIVHYKKGVASLPAVFSMPEVAHFLLTVVFATSYSIGFKEAYSDIPIRPLRLDHLLSI